MLPKKYPVHRDLSLRLWIRKSTKIIVNQSDTCNDLELPG